MAARNAAAIGHPWFPAEGINHLLVYQLRRKGRDEKWVLVSARVVPHDLRDDVHVMERYGAGYYRIDARNEHGKLCGSPHNVTIPDEEGNVPIPALRSSGGDEEEVSGGSDMLSAMHSMMMRNMQMLMAAQREEMGRVRDDARDQVQQLGMIVDKVLTAQQTARSAGDGNSPFLTFALGRMEAMTEKLEKLSADNLRLKIEAAKAPNQSGSFADLLAEKALPQLFEVMLNGRGGAHRSVTEERMERMRGLRGRPVAPRAQEPAAAPRAQEPAAAPRAQEPPAAAEEEEEAVTGDVVQYPPPLPREEAEARLREQGAPPLPPLEVVIEHLSDPANTLGPKDLRYLRAMRAEGLLPAEYLAVLKPFLDP